MIAIIDNYDSFTYNLYQYVGEVNPNVEVFRNDRVTIEKLKEMDIDRIIISPGPGYPKDSGISMDVIKAFFKNIPILGVCLGHQAIGEVFGGSIVHAKSILHGKTSMIKHNEMDIFKDIENPLRVMRYHSLVVDKRSISDELMVIAEDHEGEIMGLKHKEYPVFGLQFHPESIATNYGKDILKNFLAL